MGHYPGSLGRYMWFERKVPVLTMELREDLPTNNKPWLELQDIIGVLVGLENMTPSSIKNQDVKAPTETTKKSQKKENSKKK